MALARIIVELPKDCRIHKVIARPDDERLPDVVLQIVGPVAFQTKPVKAKIKRKRAAPT